MLGHREGVRVQLGAGVDVMELAREEESVRRGRNRVRRMRKSDIWNFRRDTGVNG